MALTDYFLKIEGIEGDSNDPQYPNWIQIDSFNWGATSNPGPSPGGQSPDAGKANVQDLNITTHVNKATPSIGQYCLNSKKIAKVELALRISGDKPQEYMRFTLTDVYCTSHQIGGTGGSGGGSDTTKPTESDSFSFGKIDVAYGSQDAKGVVASLDKKMSYDLKKGK
jgi:type VI secretion system secreted protein Hcp